MSNTSLDTSSRPDGFLGPDRWWHIIFGGLMAITLVAFLIWSGDYVSGSGFSIVLTAAILLGLFMAFNIGGNDVANSFGTSVGAGTLTMKQALLIAAVFEVAGAVIAGADVTETVRSGIVNLDVVGADPMDFVHIMMAALSGAAIWLLIATKYGLPVSTTHSIIGAIVGASLTIGAKNGTGSLDMVQWGEIGQIAVSWVLSPLLGGIVAYFLFGLIKRHVLMYNDKADQRLQELKQEFMAEWGASEEHYDSIASLQQSAYIFARPRKSDLERDQAEMGEDEVPTASMEAEARFSRALKQLDKGVSEVRAHRALTLWVPLIAAAAAVIIASMLLFKGLSNLDLEFTTTQTIFILVMIGTITWFAMSMFASTLTGKSLSRATFILFSWMQVFTAAAFAFSHGSNDIANALGPFAAILDVLRSGTVGAAAVVPGPALFAFGIALVSGLWFIGRNVIKTVGTNLTKMHPASGFAAELAAACVVLAASQLGLPVSSTHILIGAVLGVGLVNRAANWRLMRTIGLAWVITLPVAAAIGAVSVLIFDAVL